MPEFKIGDRVVCLTDYPDDNEDIRIFGEEVPSD